MNQHANRDAIVGNVISLKPILQKAALEHAVGMLLAALDEAVIILSRCDPMIDENGADRRWEMLDAAAAAYMTRLSPTDGVDPEDTAGEWELVGPVLHQLWRDVS
jgi:hypothetical protein